ncbi:hypothetical protein F3K20_12760 [Streptomyces scabiei]|uniref:hypothetical protein n=1 Tax=Streptomyces scabiei TaxID=1930 RepID=UPI001B305FE7|nr:hypothetical protein [Streptomyces sp. LBUM 1482]QTU45620.1 hypothetical protein F3K20_12760 [Streptomyces sp. LBUM 1482]
MADLAQITDEQREQLLRSMASLTAAFRQLAQACLPLLQATAEQFVLHTEALKEAGLLDDEYKPIKAADRPAWQSPYGPPPRRR